MPTSLRIAAVPIALLLLVVLVPWLCDRRAQRRLGEEQRAARQQGQETQAAEKLKRGGQFRGAVDCPRCPQPYEAYAPVAFQPGRPLPCPSGTTASSRGCVSLDTQGPLGPQLEPADVPGGVGVEGFVLDQAGDRTGPWYLWAPDGWLLARGAERAGVRHGWFAGYFDGADVWQQGRYDNGLRDGKWAVAVEGSFGAGQGTVAYISGVPDREMLFGRDEATACRFTWFNGVLEGAASCKGWRGWFSAGRPEPVPPAELAPPPPPGQPWVVVDGAAPPGVRAVPTEVPPDGE